MGPPASKDDYRSEASKKLQDFAARMFTGASNTAGASGPAASSTSGTISHSVMSLSTFQESFQLTGLVDNLAALHADVDTRPISELLRPKDEKVVPSSISTATTTPISTSAKSLAQLGLPQVQKATQPAPLPSDYRQAETKRKKTNCQRKT